jgi:hypothetical protein
LLVTYALSSREEAGEQVILGSEQTDPLSEVANLLAAPRRLCPP